MRKKKRRGEKIWPITRRKRNLPGTSEGWRLMKDGSPFIRKSHEDNLKKTFLDEAG